MENCTSESLFIYGPRHFSDVSGLPTSLFLLPPGQETPKLWDCKGLLIPSDRAVLNGTTLVSGPLVLKYRDMRRIHVRMENGAYLCPRSNGLLPPEHIEFVAQEFSYAALMALPRRSVWV